MKNLTKFIFKEITIASTESYINNILYGSDLEEHLEIRENIIVNAKNYEDAERNLNKMFKEQKYTVIDYSKPDIYGKSDLKVYEICDIRKSLFDNDYIVLAKTPLDAVKKYLVMEKENKQVKRDLTYTGQIVVTNNNYMKFVYKLY